MRISLSNVVCLLLLYGVVFPVAIYDISVCIKEGDLNIR
jgi:hypothetical protein